MLTISLLKKGIKPNLAFKPKMGLIIYTGHTIQLHRIASGAFIFFFQRYITQVFTGWLKAHDYNNFGIVLSGKPHGSHIIDPILNIRWQIHGWLTQHPLMHPGILLALLTGDRSLLEKSDYRLFQATGTSHLIAVSGLHIGLLFGFGVFLGKILSRGFRIGKQTFICYTAGLLFAGIYSLLAGMSISTQRAMLMCLLVTLALALRKRFHLWQILLFTFSIFILSMPRVLWDVSFWLSFGAVAAIAWVSLRQLNTKTAWNIQWGIFWLLTPVAAYFFGQVTFRGILANPIAIPLVSFLVLPLDLLGLLLHLLNSDIIANSCLQLADYSTHLLISYLKAVTMLPGSITHQIHLWDCALSMFGGWLIMTFQSRVRYLGLVFWASCL